MAARYDFASADADVLIETIIEAKRLFSPGGRGFASIALACHGPPEDQVSAIREDSRLQLTAVIPVYRHHQESEVAHVHAGAFEWSISSLVSVKSADEISDKNP